MKAAIAQAEGDLPRAAALLTPSQSNTDDSSSLLTRVYQAILERNPAQIIPRIKQELAKADPASVFILVTCASGWAGHKAGWR